MKQIIERIIKRINVNSIYKPREKIINESWRTYVSLQILPGVVCQKNSNDFDVILLGSHVQRCEAALCVHTTKRKRYLVSLYKRIRVAEIEWPATRRNSHSFIHSFYFTEHKLHKNNEK